MCLNCGERPAVANGGQTVPLCSVCAPKACNARGVRMTQQPSKPKLKLIAGGKR